MANKKKKIMFPLALALIVLIAALGVLLIWAGLQYNNLAHCEESVYATWAQVETQYQRRADLIPNLVEVTKAYAEHENQTLTRVTEARTDAMNVSIDKKQLTDDQLKQYSAVQGEVSAAINQLLLIQENYPDLKANTNFLQLQTELEATENRITAARIGYRGAVNLYNQQVRRFPNLLIAKLFRFDVKPHFASSEGVKEAPQVHY